MGGRQRVVLGIDSHKATLACALVDDVGRERAARTFANTPDRRRAAESAALALLLDRYVVWVRHQGSPDPLRTERVESLEPSSTHLVKRKVRAILDAGSTRFNVTSRHRIKSEVALPA
jgi:hypothetical protein